MSDHAGANAILQLVFPQNSTHKRSKKKRKLSNCSPRSADHSIQQGVQVDLEIQEALSKQHPHPVIEYLCRKGFVGPFAAQQELHCAELNIAPIADLTCRVSNGKQGLTPCTVEIKTGPICGFTKTLETPGSDTMNGPFKDIKDSYCNRALLQSCLQALCMDLGPHATKPASAYVLRYDPVQNKCVLYATKNQELWKLQLLNFIKNR
jgi:hypothetical protein